MSFKVDLAVFTHKRKEVNRMTSNAEMKKRKRPTTLIVAVVLVLLCVMCGIFGTLSKPKPKGQATATAQTVAPATEVVKPTNTPMPTNTLQPVHTVTTPSATPKATDTPKPEPTPPLKRPMILDVPSILGKKTVTDVEKMLGKPIEVLPIRVGEAPELPDGGESRTYRKDKYEFYLFFDRNGLACGFLLFNGLSDEGYLLDHWGLLMDRFGFAMTAVPDVAAPAARRWFNFSGYKIDISGAVDGPVHMVQIWKLRCGE